MDASQFFPLLDLPNDILEAILIEASPAQLAKVRATCRTLQSLLDGVSFWARKCRRDGIATPPTAYIQRIKDGGCPNFYRFLHRRNPIEGIVPLPTALSPWEQQSSEFDLRRTFRLLEVRFAPKEDHRYVVGLPLHVFQRIRPRIRPSFVVNIPLRTEGRANASLTITAKLKSECETAFKITSETVEVRTDGPQHIMHSIVFADYWNDPQKNPAHIDVSVLVNENDAAMDIGFHCKIEFPQEPPI